MYIYNITLVPANMAVNGVFRVRRWNWCVESLHKERKQRECGDEWPSCFLPWSSQTGASFQPCSYATHYLSRECVRVCVREHRKQLEVSTGGRRSVCGRTVKHVTTPVGAGGFVGGRRRASCSRRGREGRRCCWWEGRGGPGMIVTRLGWPALEADPGRVQAYPGLPDPSARLRRG